MRFCDATVKKETLTVGSSLFLEDVRRMAHVNRNLTVSFHLFAPVLLSFFSLFNSSGCNTINIWDYLRCVDWAWSDK